ncbi:nucleotidyltransferase domain-containing protein [Bradyrhizobium sp. RDM12]
MNVQTRIPTTEEAAKTLEALAKELEISPHRYEQAETSYRSLGDWLNRPASSIRQFDAQVHVQGSFGLGTVIPPISDDEHYDVDAVCEFRNLTKKQISQEVLKRRLGQEIRSYAASQSMKNPVEEGRRCWTLVYADGAQFHGRHPRHPKRGRAAVALGGQGARCGFRWYGDRHHRPGPSELSHHFAGLAAV